MNNIMRHYTTVLPVFYGVGVNPPHSDPFSLAEPHARGGSKYNQNLSFVITEPLILVSGQKSKKLKLVINFHL